MLRNIVLIALLGACSAWSLEDSLKKQFPLSKGIQHFAMNIPAEAKKNAESKIQSLESGVGSNLLQKLTSSILLKGAPLGAHRQNLILPLSGQKIPSGSSQPVRGPHAVTLQDYSFSNCSDSEAASYDFLIRKLVVSPDPVKLPGTLDFIFDVVVKDTLSDLKVNLNVSVKVGSTYITLPCIGDYGSCQYDVCERLTSVDTCPSQLTDIGLNCRCPFNKGTYTLPSPGIKADISGSLFEPGSFKASALITSMGKPVGCYNAAFQFS